MPPKPVSAETLAPNSAGVLLGVSPQKAKHQSGALFAIRAKERSSEFGSSSEGVTLEKGTPLEADKEPVRSEIPVSILLFNQPVAIVNKHRAAWSH